MQILAKEEQNRNKIQQGRIHGYRRRVWVVRGSEEIDQSSCWAGAQTPKLPVSAKKAECYGQTNRRTNGQTNSAGCRVTCMQLKIVCSIILLSL